MWEKRYEPKSGTVHVGECFPFDTIYILRFNNKQRDKIFHIHNMQFCYLKLGY